MNRRKYKYKRDRSILTNVFDNPKSSFNKRPTRPGQHCKKLYSKTYYGELLYYKQRLLTYYANLKDYQLRNLFNKVVHSNNYKQQIVEFLESRIDVILYRSGCVVSMRDARQILNHRQVTVEINNKVVLPRSAFYRVTADASISFSKKVVDRLKENLKNNTRTIPKHIVFNKDCFKINVTYSYIPNKDSYVELKNLYLDQVISYYKI